MQSLFQVIGGDKEGARKTQEEFSNTCPIISQIKSAVQALTGDLNAAKETQEIFVVSAMEVVDGTPVIGHINIKGAIHYALGDDSHGGLCMKKASLSTGVIAGGLIGILGGPAGAFAGGITGGW
jgi:hypothetical protein